MNRFIRSHDSVTCRRSPEVSSTAFDAQPPDLPPVCLMDMGFAIIGSLARHRRPPIRFLFIGSRLCSTLLSGPASRRVLFHLCASLNPSPPSGWVEDLHLLAVEHARHTKKSRSKSAAVLSFHRSAVPPRDRLLVGFLVLGDALTDPVLLTIDPVLLGLGEMAVVFRHIGLFAVLHGGLAILEVSSLLRGQRAVLNAVANALLLVFFTAVHLIDARMTGV